MSEELIKLADRVESLSGPDREVDWRIADALDLPEPWIPSSIWPPFTPTSGFVAVMGAGLVLFVFALLERIL